MKGKNILVFGGSGQIGRHLIRRLNKNNHMVTAVTRNLHQKGYVLKTQGNPGYLDVIEENIFDEEKLNYLLKNKDICLNLIGILFEKRNNTFQNIHVNFPSIISKICKQNNIEQFIHICLFDKEGYYSIVNPLGKSGDFTTSPEISLLFGEIIGLYIFYTWQEKYKNEIN